MFVHYTIFNAQATAVKVDIQSLQEYSSDSALPFHNTELNSEVKVLFVCPLFMFPLQQTMKFRQIKAEERIKNHRGCWAHNFYTFETRQSGLYLPLPASDVWLQCND